MDLGPFHNPTKGLAKYGINRFKTSKLVKKFKQSEIGRYILKKLESGEIELELSTKSEIGVGTHFGEALTGSGTTFIRNTQTFGNKAFGIKAGYDMTVSNMIHEGVHALGVGGSRRAEALARIAELQHAGIEINRASIRKILTQIKDADVYDRLPWRLNRESEHFPGVKF